MQKKSLVFNVIHPAKDLKVLKVKSNLVLLSLMCIFVSCRSREFNIPTESDQKAIATKIVVDGERLFQGIYVDELINETSQSRFCAYFAETPMLYSEYTQEELPALDHFISAIKRGAPEGIFAVLEPVNEKGSVALTPFSPVNFENTISALEKENGVGGGIIGTLKVWISTAKLARSAAREGMRTAQSVMQIRSSVAKSLSKVTVPESQARIEIETRTIFSKEIFPAARKLAAAEFATQPSLPPRASTSGGRVLKDATGEATFDLLIEVFHRTPRDTLGVTDRCKTVTEMKSMLETIKGKR